MTSFLRTAALTLSSILVFSAAARADETRAQSLFAEAKTAYAARENLAQIDVALSKLDQAFAQADTNETKYDILIMSAHTLYYKGGRATSDSSKMDIYSQAMGKANQAKALIDDYAEAYYQYAINLGRWAEAKGILSSLNRKDELIKSVQDAMDRSTRDGANGEELDYYGPARTLGRVYFKLPAFAGGSRDTSLSYLDKAYNAGKADSLNVVYYAEALAAGSRSDKDHAKQILDELLKNDPATYNLDRIPETKDEFEQARQIRKTL